VLFGAAQEAEAALVLSLDDPATGLIDVIVADNAPIGTGTVKGLTNFVDPNPTVGAVDFVGAIPGTVWTVNVDSGISKPVLGPAEIDMFAVHVSTTGAGTLSVEMTDTGFGPTTGIRGFIDAIGGTTDGTVSVVGGLGANDLEFDMAVFTPPLVFGPGPFTGSSSVTASLSGLFSLTKAVTIVHSGAGQVTSFDNNFRIQPSQAVGGEMIPLDTTMVLAAGSQYTAAWMIPALVSAIGIAIVIARKF